MSAEINREKTYSRPGQDGASTDRDAALRGASLAFGKPVIKPKPKVNTYSGTNGALAAATTQLINQRSSTLGRPSPADIERHRPNQLEHSTGFLQPSDNSISPSFIAANLAASRSVTPNHTGQTQLSPAALQRQSSFTRRSTGSIRSVSPRGSLEQPLDTSSIPPTSSLIGMFEQHEQHVKPKNGRRPAIRRSITSATIRPSTASQNPPNPPRARTPPPRATKTRKPEIKSPKPKMLTTLPAKATEPPKPSAARRPSISTPKPVPIPSNARPSNAEIEDEDASSDDSFVSAPSFKPSFRAELHDQNRRLTSSSVPSFQSTVTVDSLANAIVASSLASSRAASPSKSSMSTLYPPPPPPSRRNPHKHLFHNSKESSRTPSPAKMGLRTTMRKPKPDEEIDEGEKRRGRKNLMKKHPNKHHEGDRKRWRDEITERERKRYEAVWASNKGLYTRQGLENCVCSLVVKEIFSRSRLHNDVLEEAYALVDRQQNGNLEREEFVVGLWLIDQRLKGRKLPIRVTDSVWRSVGILSGIKVRKAGK